MSGRDDIWVVDDDEAIRFVLQRALRRRGYEVECFEDVAGVRAALQNGHPKALLTDIRLPDADGLSVVDTLERLKIEIPVIAIPMTTLSSAEVRFSAATMPRPTPVITASSIARIPSCIETGNERPMSSLTV